MKYVHEEVSRIFEKFLDGNFVIAAEDVMNEVAFSSNTSITDARGQFCMCNNKWPCRLFSQGF